MEDTISFDHNQDSMNHESQEFGQGNTESSAKSPEAQKGNLDMKYISKSFSKSSELLRCYKDIFTDYG